MDKICIIGLGYVGLPLAVAFADKLPVVGFDTNQCRIKELIGNYDSTLEISDAALDKVKSNLSFTCSHDDAKLCNIYIITVPTPIDSENRPDLAPLLSASRTVGKLVSIGDIVIYESTVYPGVTEEICVPEIEKVSGLRFNEDFFAGYSPERINPGDKKHTVTNILKVTSGSTPNIAKKVDGLYRLIITAGTHLASSIKVAEASKVIENTQRDVNIALINELALIFDQMDIDTREVIEAAATKWNFIKLSPGLVGGHCIGVDPYYLTHKAKEIGYSPNLILASRQINNGMAKFIAEKTIKEMINASRVIKGADVLVLGATFKENCPDTRNTKVVDIVAELNDYGVQVDIYDPWVEELTSKGSLLKLNPFQNDKKYDAIIIAVAHNEFIELNSDEYESISKEVSVIIDVKGIAPSATWRL